MNSDISTVPFVFSNELSASSHELKRKHSKTSRIFQVAGLV